jgi:hypothetical protein
MSQEPVMNIDSTGNEENLENTTWKTQRSETGQTVQEFALSQNGVL